MHNGDSDSSVDSVDARYRDGITLEEQRIRKGKGKAIENEISNSNSVDTSLMDWSEDTQRELSSSVHQTDEDEIEFERNITPPFVPIPSKQINQIPHFTDLRSMSKPPRSWQSRDRQGYRTANRQQSKVPNMTQPARSTSNSNRVNQISRSSQSIGPLRTGQRPPGIGPLSQTHNHNSRGFENLSSRSLSRKIDPPKEISLTDMAHLIALRTSKTEQYNYLEGWKTGSRDHTRGMTTPSLRTISNPLRAPGLRLFFQRNPDWGREEISERSLGDLFQDDDSSSLDSDRSSNRPLSPTVPPEPTVEDPQLPEPITEPLPALFNEPELVHLFSNDDPPPEILRIALRDITSLALKKPPFLRRNLKIACQDIFIDARNIRDRRRSSHTSRVNMCYCIAPSSDIIWSMQRFGWQCQLCDLFPAFLSHHGLKSHIRFYHTEVKVRFQHDKKSEVPWSVVMTLRQQNFEIPENRPARLSTSESISISPVRTLVPRLSTLSISEREETVGSNIVSQHSTRTQGHRKFDIPLQHPLNGLEAQIEEEREEKLIEMSEYSDEAKAMAILWSRWIRLNHANFISDPFTTVLEFIRQTYFLIRSRCDRREFLRWLRVLIIYKYLQEVHVIDLLKEYKRLTDSETL